MNGSGGPARWLVVLCGAALLASCGTGERATLDPSSAPSPVRTTPAAAPQPVPPRSFTVVAGGDILIHPALSDQAAADARAGGAGGYDYAPLLAGIRPVVSAADLAICHLETPLAPPGGPFSGYPTFSAPPQIAAALARTGYDACSTASNHTLDKGYNGVRRTLDALDAAGIRHTGSARSAAEAGTPAIYDVNGVRIGHLSYTYGFNGLSLPAGQPWLGNRIDPAAILAAARASRKAGAEVVIVSLHWGTEYQHEPTQEQTDLAATLVRDPAVDLILGHHAHVVQPFERVGTKWVAYGMGNQVARHSEPRGVTEEGAMARFRFTLGPDRRWQVTEARFVPTLVDLGPPIRLRDVQAALADPATPAATRTRLTQALNRTQQIVFSRGADRTGLTPGR